MPRDADWLSTAAWLMSQSAMSFVTYPECPGLQVFLGGFPLGSRWVRILTLFLMAEPLQASFMPSHMPKNGSLSSRHMPDVPAYLSSFVVMLLKPALSFPSPLSSSPLPLACDSRIASQLSLCFQSFPKPIYPINAVRDTTSNALALEPSSISLWPA